MNVSVRRTAPLVNSLGRVTIFAIEPAGLLHPVMPTPCKHPKVRVVSRQDDIEFVECQDCGEIFDSEEFRDMEIEEKTSLGFAQEDVQPE